MKPINRILILCLLFSAIIISSCKKDDVPVGNPSINQVVNSLRSDVLTGANLEDWIIIKGQNFYDVTKILLNSEECSLKDAYISPTEICLKVPRKIPEQTNNKITLETERATISFDFVITIPKLIIDTVNSFAKAGKILALSGKNFDIYGIDATAMVFFGNIKATIKAARRDSLYLVVPANIPVSTKMKILNAKNVEIPIPGLFQDTARIPKIVLKGMVNEYTKEGQKLVITGKNFEVNGIDTNCKIKFGNTDVAINRATDDSIYVVVPSGLSSNLALTITSNYGKKFKVPGMFRDNSLVMLTTFDSYNGWNVGTNSFIIDGGTDGKCLHVAANYPGGWDSSMSLMTFHSVDWAGNAIPQDVFDNQGNYYFEFEVMSTKPIKQLRFALGSNVTWQEHATYYWNSSLNTAGKWITMSIPMNNFGTLKGVTAGGKFIALMFHGGDAWSADFSMDNLRIVQKTH